MTTSATFFFDGPQFEQAVADAFGLASVHCDAIALAHTLCHTYGWTLDTIHYHMAVMSAHFKNGSTTDWWRELRRLHRLGVTVAKRTHRYRSQPKGFEIGLAYAVCDALLAPRTALHHVIVLVSQRRDFRELVQETKRYRDVEIVTAVPSSRNAQIQPIPSADAILIDEATFLSAYHGPSGGTAAAPASRLAA